MSSSETDLTDRPPLERARWEKQIATRYYEARLVRDLFGAYQLMRVWGGIGIARGAIRFYAVTGPAAFVDELARIDKRRVKRGYVLRL